MSQIKHLLERDSERRGAAIEIAIAAGVLERCEVDDDVVGTWRKDIEQAYKVGNAMISLGDPTVTVSGRNRKAMTDEVNRVVEELQYNDCTHKLSIDRAVSKED